MNVIGDRLRQRREELNYSQGAFMPQSSLGQWERGDTPQALHQLAELARRYEVSADWLLNLTDDRVPANGRSMPPYGPEVLDMMRDAPDLVRQQIHEVVRVIHEASIIERDLLELVAWFQSEMPPELIAEIGQGMRLRFRTGDRQAALDYAKARLTAFFDAEPKLAAEAD